MTEVHWRLDGIHARPSQEGLVSQVGRWPSISRVRGDTRMTGDVSSLPSANG